MGRAGSPGPCGLPALLRVSWAESFCGASTGLCQHPHPEALWVSSGSERHVPLSPSQRALHLGANPQSPLNLPVVVRWLIFYRDQFYQVERGLSVDRPESFRFNAAGFVATGRSLAAQIPAFVHFPRVEEHSATEKCFKS